MPDVPPHPSRANARFNHMVIAAYSGSVGAWTGLENAVLAEDRAVHDWYRFVLSFPPHLVRRYLEDFGINTSSLLLDPFCGTGTTLVEAKLRGVASVGLEAAPMAHLASSVKTDWEPEPAALISHAERVGQAAATSCRGRLRTLDHELASLLLANSISPKPLHRVIGLLEALKDNYSPDLFDHERLALARILPTEIGNLRFGPEVGLGTIKDDAPVIDLWLAAVRRIAADLAEVPRSAATSRVLLADSRQVPSSIADASVDAVFTSPPYPNEKDYTRTTRLESVLLGFFGSKAELRAFKRNLVRSNTRGIYASDTDDEWVASHPEVQRIAEAIEMRRIELGKTSGFERQYARVTRQYFGGMVRHLEALKRVLKPGARLGYVVGDQASYLRVMIRTGEILADLGEQHGYKLDRIDLFRTRPSTVTREQLREEVVVLVWPGA